MGWPAYRVGLAQSSCRLIRRKARGPMPYSQSLEQSTSSYIEGEWYKRDLRFAAAQRSVSKGYFTDADHIAYEDADRTPYFQEFLRPSGFKWGLGLIFPAIGDHFVLSIQRALTLLRLTARRSRVQWPTDLCSPMRSLSPQAGPRDGGRCCTCSGTPRTRLYRP